jgi:hypothetical protein
MLEFRTREQCEQFQMSHFGISCATCERWDVECPWGRRDETPIIAKPLSRRVIRATKFHQRAAQKKAA